MIGRASDPALVLDSNVEFLNGEPDGRGQHPAARIARGRRLV